MKKRAVLVSTATGYKLAKCSLVWIGVLWNAVSYWIQFSTISTQIQCNLHIQHLQFQITFPLQKTVLAPTPGAWCVFYDMLDAGSFLYFYFCKRETHNRQRLLQTKIQLHVPHSFRSTSVTATKFPCHVGDRCALVWHKYVGWMCTWAFVGSSFALSSPLYNCKKSCWSRCLWVCLQW